MSATAILKLSQAGFTDAQVTALAEYFDPQMATKADVGELKYDIEKVRADLSMEIEPVRADLSVEIARLRTDLELKIASLDAKIGETQADTIKWVAGRMVPQGAAIVALIKFLPGTHS
jgi:DNA-binding transcriptional regulator YiaG